jgi:hypothetical protein
MNQRTSAFSLLAAGAAAGLSITYAARSARARLRKRIAQSQTIAVPRERVEAFIESRDRMLLALGYKRMLVSIDRLEVREAPAGRGTEVHLSMRGAGKYQVKEVLRRLKALLEAGEIPSGRRYAA